MAANSTIEWTERTWNPVLGCTLCSEGCVHCYAEAMSRRLAGMARTHPVQDRKQHYLSVINNRGRWSGHLEKVEEALKDPLRWKTPSKIFVNSMSDLFHPNVETSYIHKVFDVMSRTLRHQFQILTKRSERLLKLSPTLPWTQNIWQGVSVELSKYKLRIDNLRRTDAAVKFLSLEPLLGPLGELDLSWIDWVIVGGESGPGCRPMDIQWVRDIRRQCQQAGVAFFFKQWGHIQNNPDAADPTAKQNGGGAKGGRMLDGQLYDEMPKVPVVRMPMLF